MVTGQRNGRQSLALHHITLQLQQQALGRASFPGTKAGILPRRCAIECVVTPAETRRPLGAPPKRRATSRLGLNAGASARTNAIDWASSPETRLPFIAASST